MRHLSKDEVRQFYEAYRAMEAAAYTLKDEAERFHQEAVKRALQRDLLLFWARFSSASDSTTGCCKRAG